MPLYRTSNEANFRTSAYEAITSYVTHATNDVIPVVQNTLITILIRMEQLLGMQVRAIPFSFYSGLHGYYRTKLLVLMTATTGMNCKATSAAL
jgi:hypothetical protein